mgnify:CR=1 FL=1
MKYRKKAINVEARQVNLANIDQVAEWCNGFVRRREDNYEPRISIMQLEGVTNARLGDWVVRGAIGDFTVWTDLQFHQLYEKVED